MTPDELDAIRARDAAPIAIEKVAGKGWVAVCLQADQDRRALLAEVDRLTEACQEMLSAMLSASRNETTQWALGQERARIHAAVVGLRVREPMDDAGTCAHVDGPCGFRAAVLAAIGGVPATTITNLPDIGTGYPEARSECL